MKYFIFLCLLSLVVAEKMTSKVLIKEKSAVLSPKKVAKIAGFVSGATVGVAKGIVKKHGQKGDLFIPVRPVEPKYQVKYVSVVKPILVREEQQFTEPLYIKRESKIAVVKKKKAIIPFLKGFMGGKFVGKSFTKLFKKD